jgi:hypothetical protein
VCLESTPDGRDGMPTLRRSEPLTISRASWKSVGGLGRPSLEAPEIYGDFADLLRVNDNAATRMNLGAGAH